jgi:hypothetical protein
MPIEENASVAPRINLRRLCTVTSVPSLSHNVSRSCSPRKVDPTPPSDTVPCDTARAHRSCPDTPESVSLGDRHNRGISAGWLVTASGSRARRPARSVFLHDVSRLSTQSLWSVLQAGGLRTRFHVLTRGPQFAVSTPTASPCRQLQSSLA